MNDNPETGSSSALPGDAEVSQWLHRLRLDQYAELFAQNAITPPILAQLTDDDLKELGVKILGHRTLILSEIARMAIRTTGAIAKTTAQVQPAPASATTGTTGPVPSATATVSSAAPTAPTARASRPVATAPAPVPPPATADQPKARKRSYKVHFGGGFLAISILVHVFFGLAATYIVVQTMSQRKLVFQGGPPSPNQRPAAKPMI